MRALNILIKTVMSGVVASLMLVSLATVLTS